MMVPDFSQRVSNTLLDTFHDSVLLELFMQRFSGDAEAARGEARIFVDGVEVDPRGGGRPGARPGSRPGGVIDGDYRDVSEQKDQDDDDQPQRRIGK